ncbi:MAG: DMT family transporter [Candidatus Puniceispirillaceae bacterium]
MLNVGLLRAVIFMVIGGVSIALMQAAVKLIGLELHPFIITLYRAGLVFVVLLPILFWRGRAVFNTSSIRLQVVRGGIGGLGMLCVFTGLSMISLAEVTVLLFTVPIFATLLSIVFLSEKVGVRRWTAIFVGFLGILIIARPQGSVSTGHLFILCAALSWSTSILIAKKLTEKDTVISITFWQAMGCVPLAFIASLFVWELPSFVQLGALLGIAALGTVGHAMLYAALKVGQVSVILPLDYIRIIWSAGLGFILFGQLPTLHLYAGSLLIIAATAFLSYREVTAGEG